MSVLGPDILFFFLVIAGTLGITYWAARRTKSRESFYTADRSIKGWQNGLAIAGDFMSAATFLGIVGLFSISGFDAFIYILVPPFAFAILIFLIADRLRNLGRYTFADVISSRLEEKPARVFAALSTLISAIMYLVAQVVGAGGLIEVLFGIDYSYAVMIVGALMVVYVAFGGMLATTWVQITKAVLLMLGVVYLAIATLDVFEFNIEALYAAAVAAHPEGNVLVSPGGLNLSLLSAFSLAVGLLFGLVGSPHILMRFFTVANARQARVSAFTALLVVSFVFVLIFFIIGYGATALVTTNPEFLKPSGAIIGGNNMIAIHLSKVLGGEILLGIISAVAFATILAVVAGLTLASASAISHDVYARVIRKGQSTEKEEMFVSRIATLLIGLVAILLGIAFKGQNIAYLVALALVVAASANFPVLLLSIYWRGLTTRGAVIGGYVGLGSALAFVVLGPAVWVGVLGNETPVFPFAYPAIFSMTAAFVTIWLVSVLDRSERSKMDKAAFDAQQVQSLLGD
ncbi:MAG: cation/acetate symporter ActP [Proteobacteria bacterium]|nr:cation/acetate symporter ActP [Pseudomonadota bacterium]